MLVQSTRWAGRETLAAQLAGRIVQGDVKCSGNLNVGSSFPECQGAIHLHFFTNSYTPATAYALVGVVFYSFIAGCVVVCCL